MALRILSGMIFVPNGGTAQGSVVISFKPFQLAARSNPAFELRKEQEIGPRERSSDDLLRWLRRVNSPFYRSPPIRASN